MDETNKRTGGERCRVDDFPKDYKPYVRDPNRVYKKRVGQKPNGKTYYFDDLTGERFGLLTVIELDHIKRTKTKPEYYWRCKCWCGNETIVTSGNLKWGAVQSCGCYQAEAHARRMEKLRYTHGLSKDSLYRRWRKMNDRTCNPKNPEYPEYSKYGICDEWKRSDPFGEPITDLTPYYNFRDWALANGFREDLTIDRYKDPNGPYAPWNCRWVNMIEQNNNRNVNVWYWDGEEWLTIPQMAAKYNVPATKIRQKLAPGDRKPWTIHEVMTWICEPDKLGKRNGPNSDGVLYQLGETRAKDLIVLIKRVPPPPDGGPYMRHGYKPDGQKYKEG